MSVRRQNLPRMDRHGRRRCSQCSCLIGHWYWQSQGTTVPGLFVYVCISPLQGYFPVSCGAVLPQECGHSTITLALAGFLLLFLNFSVPTSKTDVHHVLQPCSFPASGQGYQLQGRLSTVCQRELWLLEGFNQYEEMEDCRTRAKSPKPGTISLTALLIT